MGKKMKAALEKIEMNKVYPLEEALRLVKESSYTKFDESVDLAINLGIDPRKSDQMVKGSVVLPHGLGKILGPKGLMPNPKLGTVTFDIAKAVKEIKAGKVEYRAEKAGIVHVSIGKVSFDMQKLFDNAMTVVDSILKAKPATSKGRYLKKESVSSTMGLGIAVDVASVGKGV